MWLVPYLYVWWLIVSVPYGSIAIYESRKKCCWSYLILNQWWIWLKRDGITLFSLVWSTTLSPPRLPLHSYSQTLASPPHIPNIFPDLIDDKVIDCSLYYRMASGSGAPSLGPKGSLTASTSQAIRLLNNESDGYIDYLHWPLPPLFLHCCYSLFIIFA